jgi:hypothetical protein
MACPHTEMISMQLVLFDTINRIFGARTGSHSYACGPRFDGKLETSVERSVCLLLLGDPEAAQAVLGLSAGSERKPDPGVLDFVRVSA